MFSVVTLHYHVSISRPIEQRFRLPEEKRTKKCMDQKILKVYFYLKIVAAKTYILPTFTVELRNHEILFCYVETFQGLTCYFFPQTTI